MWLLMMDMKMRPGAVIRLAGSVCLAGLLLLAACSSADPESPSVDRRSDTGETSVAAVPATANDDGAPDTSLKSSLKITDTAVVRDTPDVDEELGSETPETTTTEAPNADVTAAATDAPAAAADAPLLAGELTANCQPDEKSNDGIGPGIGVGETAVDFTLDDISGLPVNLSELLAEKPVVMIFGSFT